MVGAVALFDVFVSHGKVLEVNVDIRHVDAVRVKETLEQELILDRVEVRDAEAVGDDASCGGATPRSDEAAPCTRGGYVVLHYEEVVRETHPADGLELEFDPLLLLVGKDFAVALVGAPVGQVTQVGDGVDEFVAAVVAVLVVASGVDDVLVALELGVDAGEEVLVYLITRKDRVAVDAVGFDLVRDLHGVVDGFRVIREQGQHLLFRLEVFLLGVAQAARVVEVGVGGDADEAVVDRAVLLADEVDVVGRDDLDAVLLAEGEDLLIIYHLLVIDVDDLLVGLRGEVRHLGLVEHDLEVVVVAEDPLVPADGFVKGGFVACDDGSRHFAGHAGGGADESFVVFFNNLAGDSRAVVHALDVGGGDYLDEVVVALEVLREEDKVEVALLLAPVVPFGHIDLTADDGLHAGVLRGHLEELLDAIEVSVVGYGEGGHAELIGPFEKVFNCGEPVEDRVLRVDVKVGKRHRSYLCWKTKIVKGRARCKKKDRNFRSFYNALKFNYFFAVFAAFLLAAPTVASYMTGVPIMMEA